MNKAFYSKDIGYWETISEPSQKIIEGYPEDTVEVTIRPSPLHKLDEETLEWIAPTQKEVDAAKANEVRVKRDILLQTEVDPVVTNPLRWADMSTEEKESWSNYRNSLLNITEQTGFPHEVEWPVKPT